MSRFADVRGVVTLAAAAGSPASSALDPTLGRLLAVVLALVAGAACATVQKPTPLKSLTPADLSRPADWEYKIQSGDELDVEFYFNPARLLPEAP